MKLVCKNCGHIIVKDYPKNDEHKLNVIIKNLTAAKFKPSKKQLTECDYCNEVVPLIKEISDNIYITVGNQILSPKEQYDWLCRVPDDDYIKFNIKTRFENMFINKIVAIPNKYRYDKNGKTAHPITANLDNIFTTLAKVRDDPKIYHNDVYQSIVAYIKLSGQANLENKTSLLDKLTTKKGDIRLNGLGKTTSKISRSVIICNPTTRCGTVCMGKQIAVKGTIKETVNSYNFERLSRLYENGDNYPGIKFIYKKKEGFAQSINNGTKIMEIGDKIDRHLLTGDIVGFGRQPALWAECLMGCYVVVEGDNAAFSINIPDCAYYNADFDGDQMTIYIMDRPAVRAEMEIKMSVNNHFICNETINPWLGQAQDTIVGCALLTMPWTKFKRSQVYKFLENTTLNYIQLDKEIYTGREVIELVIPPVTYYGKSKFMSEIPKEYIPYIDPKEAEVIIKKGKYIQGIMDASSVKGKKTGSIYHVIYKEFGVKKALDVIYDMQQVINEFLQLYGFSISLKDFMLNKQSRDKINLIKESVIAESIEYSKKLDNGEIEAPYGKELEDFFEENQLNILQKANSMFKGPILESHNITENSLIMMIASGSKGSMSNLYYLVGGVGQIDKLGKRLPNKLSYGDTLPYFTRWDYDPRAKGFVRSSISEGFGLSEMYPQADKSRDDIITKGLTVAVAGSKSRVSMKSTETAIIDNRNFISFNNGKNILTLTPNENMFEFKHLEYIKLPWVKSSTADFEAKYYSKFPEYNKKLLRIRNKYRKNLFIKEGVNINREFTDVYLGCINIQRLVMKYVTDDEDKNYEEKYAIIENFMKNEIHKPFGNWGYVFHIRKILKLLKYNIWFELNPNVIKFLSVDQVKLIINEIYNTVLLSIIEPGTAIGMQYTQSVIAPITQFLIDAHHKSASGGSKTEAIAELNNILEANMEKNIKFIEKDKAKKAPKKIKNAEQLNKMLQMMYIYLKPEYEQDEGLIRRIINDIEFIKLDAFVEKAIIKYGDIDPKLPIYKNILDVIGMYNKDRIIKPHFVLKLNKEKLINKNIVPQDIANVLIENYPNVITFPGNISDKEPIIIIHIENDKSVNMMDIEKWLQTLLLDIISTKIKGLNGIVSAKIQPLIASKIEEDGSIKPKRNSFFIRTVGINLDGALRIPEIDPSRLFCNNLIVMNEYFGITAVRKRAIAQLEFILSELEVSHPNYLLYGDIITYKGRIININESGVDEMEPDNFMLKLSARGPIKVITNSSLSDTYNELSGISGHILMGQSPKIGTYYNDIIINEEFVKSQRKDIDSLFE